MYQKIFQSGGSALPPIPMLIIVERVQSDIVVGLRGLGWSRFGEVVSNAPGAVDVTPTELRVTVNGVCLLKQRDSLAPTPTGWYEAVASLSQRCLVVVVRSGQLGAADCEAELARLIGTDQAACALIPFSAHD
ncbi:hypothetical protein [Plantibacter sp. MMLR14_011]|uniref:hypothetical protein n=1 Tax=Plantibacter sp. MMLR14_011 TaxID=1898746 RepID=UPI00111457BB|nr:hypothetical protein [Plantibacter sp. MMLR14_011]